MASFGAGAEALHRRSALLQRRVDRGELGVQGSAEAVHNGNDGERDASGKQGYSMAAAPVWSCRKRAKSLVIGNSRDAKGSHLGSQELRPDQMNCSKARRRVPTNRFLGSELGLKRVPSMIPIKQRAIGKSNFNG